MYERKNHQGQGAGVSAHHLLEDAFKKSDKTPSLKKTIVSHTLQELVGESNESVKHKL